ncbi:MAG TPA: hypothetical protein VFR59_00300, partial [Steroidobacteraceae bacterium]|nr:hypothetical protein [Steroidobacteraceae bacterium]
MALAAYFVGRDEEYLGALERAFSEFLDHGASRRAIRCAFWIGIWFLLRGEQGRSNGWLSRVQRLLGAEGDCVEQGYPLIASSTRRIGAGDLCGAEVDAATAAELGERFGDVDLSACARHLLGRALLQQGRISEGLASLDEAMLVVTGGSVSPLVTGLTYCGVIEGYQQVYALARAREWTEALSRWCDEQPEMLAFSGTCLVHRAELMQLLGSWPGALAEAQRACERCLSVANRRAAAAAHYQAGEVHRLRGDYAAAEAEFRDASRFGHEPQPGLA